MFDKFVAYQAGLSLAEVSYARQMVESAFCYMRSEKIGFTTEGAVQFVLSCRTTALPPINSPLFLKRAAYLIEKFASRSDDYFVVVN